MTTLQFARKVSAACKGADVVAVVAPKSALEAGWHRKALGARWASALDRPAADARPGDLGSVAGTYGGKGAPRRLFVAALPDRVGRHNSPTRAEFIRHCVAQVRPGESSKMAVVVHLEDPSHMLAASVAVARCFPLFSAASNHKHRAKLRVSIVGALADGTAVGADAFTRAAVDSVRLAARLVDTPPQEMKTSDVEKEARKAARGIPGVRVTSIVGDKLLGKRMGGIHGVGRTALVPPRLVVLKYTPKKKPRRTVALVGKGIIYDTGGLNIKVGGHMSSMKCDMGGSAAVLGAFLTLARTNSPDRVYALLCLAENAVGPDSYRPDDILRMHSGHTVEINNTDAEGRLVLADGVSYAARDLEADVVIDAATLTGAQLITTGHVICAVATNRDGLESRAVDSGRRTGDLAHPLLFVPEFLRQEFASKVADMRNSVKDRMNAQSSAAAQFIYNHIDDLDPPWIHVDLAGPAFRESRGTGFGVALIADLVRNLKAADLAS